MRISDWSSDVCSSDLELALGGARLQGLELALRLVDAGLVALGLAQLGQREGVIQFAFDAMELLQRALQMGALAHHLLGPLGIVPQRRVFRLGVQLIEAQGGGIDVKDASSAGPTTV